MMRKQILLAALAVVAMTSCSNDESVEPASTSKIGFADSYLTRGAVDAGAFDILAYKGADEATAATFLTGGVASDTYTLGTGFGTGSYYYDGNASTNYYFYGYGKMDGTSLAKVDTENYTIAGKTLTYTNKYGKDDLVSARLNVKGDVTGPQALAFYHALAKVRFTIAKGADIQHEIIVSQISFDVNYIKGTLDLATATGADRVVDVIINNDPVAYFVNHNLVLTGTQQDAGSFYVIPQKLNNRVIVVTYTVDGNKQQKVFTDINTELLGGKSVKYAITVNLNKIELDASNEDWGTETDAPAL